MKKQFVLFFILFAFLISQIKSNQCPDNCNCTDSLENCLNCLELTYKRNYSITDNTCPCITDYVEAYPPTSYCCASNCSLCYQLGCYSCYKNWTTNLLNDWYICICKPNYQYDTDSKDCICRGQIKQYAHKYYQPNKYECNVCPQKCQCLKNACNSCLQSLNRIIATNIQNISTCYCKPSYQQVNGTCILKTQINCSFPKVLINSSCDCIEPYYLDYNNKCVCKSLKNPSKYYQYHGVCYACPELCDCNELGCYRCLDSMMTIYENHCTCKNLSGIIYINNRCECINPLNLETCACASQIQPAHFYLNSQNICYFCPIDCVCDQNGCVSCNQNSNRNNSCYCNQLFIEIDRKCIGCPINFIFSDDNCLCPNQLSPKKAQNFYFDEDTSTCRICPVGCRCDETGCYFCQQYLFRTIDNNSQNIKICDCNIKLNFEENLKINICQCKYPYTFNATTNQCECHQPYYINGSECICKSFRNSSEYYLYNYNDCRLCPDRCNCTEKGCISCDKNQGRVILISNHTHICPCIPIILNQSSGSCKFCLSHQYLWRNKCLDCDMSCISCNQNGCLSCSFDHILQDRRCVCTVNDTLNHIYNQNGTCICITGYFLNIDGECELCPLNCKNCYFSQERESIIMCSECNINNFRTNDPYNNCPCLNNYIENIILSSYCCHQSCAACNISGCTECLPFTYRYINSTDPNNIICSCMKGFIQNASQVCICPIQSYLHINECLPCPKYCSNCQMIQKIQIFYCQCLNGLNRVDQLSRKTINNIIYDINDCICAEGFISISSNQPYCYSRFCTEYGLNGTCNSCKNLRELSSDKIYCNCLVGYYQDANKVCQKCYSGCLQCLSLAYCQVCQIGQEMIVDNQITQSYCIYPDKDINLLYQYDNYTIFQLKPQFIKFQSLLLEIYLLNNPGESYDIDEFDFKIIEGVIIFKFQRFSIQNKNPYFVKITLYFDDNTELSSFQLQKDSVYTTQQLFYSDIQVVFIYLFISFIMSVSLIFNIIGMKQNDIIFYCQTIYFFAMKVDDPQMIVVPFFNNFRITIFKFKFESSNSPFDYIISNWHQYMEYSSGNYKYYNIDSNLLRNAGLALYLTIQNAVLIMVLKLIYNVLYNMKDRKYRNFAQKYKRSIYRFFEWCYKVFMYPVLFYSLSTVICYNTNYSLINQSFRRLNLIIAIVMIILYIIITVMQYLYNQNAIIHKYDNLIEFGFEIIISIAIVSIHSTPLLIIILLVFTKGCLQLYNYQLRIRKKLTLNQKVIIISIILIQSLIFIPIYFSNLIATIVPFLISLSSIIGLKLYLHIRIMMHFKYDKKNYNNETQKQYPQIMEQRIDSAENMTTQEIHKKIIVFKR